MPSMFSPKGDRFILYCERQGTGHLILLDAKDESVIWESDIGDFISLKTLQFNSSGTKILLGFAGQRTNIVHSGKGNITAFVGRDEDYGHFQTTCAAWHPDGRRFAVGDYLEGVRVFEVDDSSDAPKELAHFGNGGSADAVAFSPDGKQLIVGNRSQRVDVYELESQQLLKSFRGHLSALRSVSASPTGELIASSANDGAIKVWRRTDPPASRKSRIHNGSGAGHGQFSWQQRGEQVVVRDPGGEQVAELKGFREFELTSRFFPKVNRCLFYETFQLQGPSSIWIYDTQTWELEHTMRAYTVAIPWGSVAGDFAVTSTKSYVERFNGRTGKVDRMIVHPTGDVKVALSPKAEWLATAWKGEVKLWDIESGIEIANLYGHRPGGWMPRLAWGNTGRYFATSSIDQTIRIWDAQEKVELQTLRGLQSTPSQYWFAFSADDTRFLGADAETYRVWDVQTGRELLSAKINDASMARIYDAFQSTIEEEPFGLTETQFRFETLRKAETLGENKTAVEQYEHQSQHSLARRLIGNQTDGPSHKRALLLAARALELNPTDSRLFDDACSGGLSEWRI